MADLRIDTLQAHYRLPPSRIGERERLDRLLRESLDDPLELAVDLARARLGIRPEELICIRRVRVPVRLRLSAGDRDLITAWSLELAGVIEQRIRDAHPGLVVRYASRHQALADLAAGVATGSRARAWAWHQLGLVETPNLVSSSEAAAALVRALSAEPEAIVSSLRRLADTGLLPALIRRLSAQTWRILAERALLAAGLPRLAALVLPRATIRNGSRDRVVRAPLMGAFRESAALLSATQVPVLPCAVLAALDAEAGIAAEPHRAGRLIGEAADLLTTAVESRSAELNALTRTQGNEAGSGIRSSDAPDNVQMRPGEISARAEFGGREAAVTDVDEPTRPSPQIIVRETDIQEGKEAVSGTRNRNLTDDAKTPRVQTSTGADFGVRDGEAAGDSYEPAKAQSKTSLFAAAEQAKDMGRSTRENASAPKQRGRSVGPRDVQPSSHDNTWRQERLGVAEASAEPPPWAYPDEAPSAPEPIRTEFGGLLFLISVLGDLELPRRMAAAPALADRPLALGLHSLGAALAGCPAADAALAAFCGLVPGTDPPWSQGDGDDPKLMAAVAGWCDEVRAALHRRLDPDADDPDGLLFELVRREAVVRGEPGWIELVFSLDLVSVAIRRAGLDLDPGWVPWLGVVIRYVYE